MGFMGSEEELISFHHYINRRGGTNTLVPCIHCRNTDRNRLLHAMSFHANADDIAKKKKGGSFVAEHSIISKQPKQIICRH